MSRNEYGKVDSISRILYVASVLAGGDRPDAYGENILIIANNVSSKQMTEMIKAAIALPEPVNRGSAAMRFLARMAFRIATGPKMIAKQKTPKMAQARASRASTHGMVTTSGSGLPWIARDLQVPQ